MKIQLLSIFALSTLLAACSCCDTPPPPVVECGIVPGSVEDFCKNVGDRVYFDFDKAKVLPCGQDTLRRQAAWLCQYQQYRITVVGHCDERGTSEYNFVLGERRAEAAKRLLVEYGVPENRIDVCSMGKEHPLVMGSDERTWQENRVAITVLDGCEPVCERPAAPAAAN